MWGWFLGFRGVLKCDESQIHDLGRREGGALVISGDFCDFFEKVGFLRSRAPTFYCQGALFKNQDQGFSRALLNIRGGLSISGSS